MMERIAEKGKDDQATWTLGLATMRDIDHMWLMTTDAWTVAAVEAEPEMYTKCSSFEMMSAATGVTKKGWCSSSTLCTALR